MNNNKMYSDYRYPAPIISHTVWLYFIFKLPRTPISLQPNLFQLILIVRAGSFLKLFSRDGCPMLFFFKRWVSYVIWEEVKAFCLALW